MKTYMVTFDVLDVVTCKAAVEAESLEEAKEKALHEHLYVYDEQFNDRFEHRDFEEPLEIENMFVLEPMTIEEDTNDNRSDLGLV